jgi:hypothetical protein
MVVAQITKAVRPVRSGDLAATLDNRRRVSKGLEVRLLSNPVPGASGHSARRIDARYHGMPVTFDDSFATTGPERSFDLVLADGPPDSFSPAPEADAIRDALRDVSGRFAA